MPSCCAFGCKNKKSGDDCRNKTFFRFPFKNPSLVKQWLAKIKRDGFKPSSYSILCSDHFDENCFIYQPFTNRRSLKPNSVPSKFIFSKDTRCRREIIKHPLPSTSSEADNDNIDHTSQGSRTMVDAEVQTESFNEIIDKLAQQQEEIDRLKFELEKTKFIPENIGDDVKMKAVTSFSRERFHQLFTFLNIEKDSLRPCDLFYMFLVKLRTGISNEFLSLLFHVSDSTVSRHFNYVVSVLHAKLKLLNIFPPKQVVLDAMPRNFRKENKDCRIIIDCTEFPIQKPNSPIEQQMTFSHYKNTNTLKGMIGIMPCGAISFISPLFCGSISDKEIFLKSGLLNRLEPNDVVMADKGFLIGKELEKIGCHLKQPLFLKDKIQFEIDEMIKNCKLSNKRVTVERAISRIKQYKYFEGSIPYTALHSINSVFFVTCMLCNFHNPLIKKG